ncbi:MAG TPA: hypothetical protein PKO09_00240 [Anaerolineae bacterium]|nr:hypothetical protein [Anaerolineae bacterium]
MTEQTLRRILGRLLRPAGILLIILLASWTAMAPAEARIGNLIKLVYVHGALVLSGMLAFSLAGLLAIVALLARRPSWFRAADAAGRGALLAWIVCAISAMAVTKLTWGQLVAWSEPRVRSTALILLAALALEVVARMVNQCDFGAVVRIVMGIAPWIVTRQAEVIRHPVDPIGGSGSTAIQAFFLLIVLTVVALVLDLMAWLWVAAELRQLHNRERPRHPGAGEDPCVHVS